MHRHNKVMAIKSIISGIVDDPVNDSNVTFAMVRFL